VSSIPDPTDTDHHTKINMCTTRLGYELPSGWSPLEPVGDVGDGSGQGLRDPGMALSSGPVRMTSPSFTATDQRGIGIHEQRLYFVPDPLVAGRQGVNDVAPADDKPEMARSRRGCG
jgi:hypothetical protein